MFSAVDWNAVTAIAAVIGLILTGIGSIFVGIQLRLSQKISRSQFMLELYELMQQYNEIDIRLKNTDWPEGREGPFSNEEWNQVRRYMGIFERIQTLIDDDILTIDQVDKFFSHRVFALVKNKIIHQKCLLEEKEGWYDFIRLWRTLEKCRVYRHLASTQKANRQSAQETV